MIRVVNTNEGFIRSVAYNAHAFIWWQLTNGFVDQSIGTTGNKKFAKNFHSFANPFHLLQLILMRLIDVDLNTFHRYLSSAIADRTDIQ